MGDVCGGMYMFATVMCDFLPVLILIDWVSVVLSRGGRRSLVFALVFVNSMCLLITEFLK